MLTVSGLGPWHLHFGAASFKDLTGGIQSLVTAAGVVVGGCWAYFKFVRGRTYRPRLAVDLSGQWRRLNDTDVLHVRVRVTNIGASMVALNQYGSGLRVGLPANPEHNEFRWQFLQLARRTASAAETVDRVFEILREHAWIEPGETVSDDLLLDLNSRPTIYKLELALLWSLSGDHADQFSPDDIEVFARRILGPEDTLSDKLSSKG
ncbi:hypothetical protein A9W95_13455 [Mycobacterium sp. 1423905.2]|nr:hypothetical protein A9W95_13455 [Mycobacterium sp. 1423905.2]